MIVDADCRFKDLKIDNDYEITISTVINGKKIDSVTDHIVEIKSP